MLQKAEYTRNINKSRLILTAGTDCVQDKDGMEMFRYNEIPYFLKMQAQRVDMKMRFCYDITSRRSLEQLLEYKVLDYQLLQKILSSLDQACIHAENYMLTENDILLEPEFIFTDSESEQMTYCYFPGNGEDICRQFQTFMEYLLQHLEHKDEQAVQLAYGVHQRVTEEKAALHMVLADIAKGNAGLNIIRRLKADRDKIIENTQQDMQPEQMPFIQHTADHGFLQSPQQEDTAVQEPPKQNAQEKKKSRKAAAKKAVQPPKFQQKESAKKQTSEKLKNLLRKKIYTDSSRNMEEETLLEEDMQEEMPVSSPTVCLMPETEEIQNQFVYQGTDRSRDFYCTQGKMILGSSAEESDICIPLPLISRVHARIEADSKGTYLEDMNSKNGTHVNGELLQYRERRLLQKGDIVNLAGESYSFH